MFFLFLFDRTLSLPPTLTRLLQSIGKISSVWRGCLEGPSWCPPGHREPYVFFFSSPSNRTVKQPCMFDNFLTENKRFLSAKRNKHFNGYGRLEWIDLQKYSRVFWELSISVVILVSTYGSAAEEGLVLLKEGIPEWAAWPTLRHKKALLFGSLKPLSHENKFSKGPLLNCSMVC